MNVSIVKEWILPADGQKFRRTTPSNPMFYVVRLQKGRMRYLKIGTAENGIGARFGQKDYQQYSTIKLLYVAEVSCDKNPKDACYHVEDLTRSALREMKGFTFVRNDRFKYFQIPCKIPIYTDLKTFREIEIGA